MHGQWNHYVHIHFVSLVWAHVHQAFLCCKIKNWPSLRVKQPCKCFRDCSLVGSIWNENICTCYETKFLFTRCLPLTSQYPVVHWSHAVNYIVTVGAWSKEVLTTYSRKCLYSLSWWMLTGSSSVGMSSALVGLIAQCWHCVCVCVCSLVPRPPPFLFFGLHSV